MTLKESSPSTASVRPYKLLDYYEASDADIFFGRTEESQLLSGLVRDHRLVLLYGASGTGKTSLILAGTSPLLHKTSPQHKLIYVRALTNPGPTIRQTVRRSLSRLRLSRPTADEPPSAWAQLRNQLHQCFNQSELRDLCFDIGLEFDDLSGDTKRDHVRELILSAERQGLLSHLIETCRRERPLSEWADELQVKREIAVTTWEAETHGSVTLASFLSDAADLLDATIVLILDQFEEFFIRLSPEIRKAFINELAGLFDTPLARVKVLISLREEWLANIGEIEARIPEVFNNRIRLLPLQREQARQAINGPVEKLGVQYEASLVDKLLDDLAADVPDSANGAVIPPQLQLVCSTLYSRLEPPESTISLATYEQMGGAGGVLQQYLEDELSHLRFDDRLLTRGLLEELVTSQRTKAVKSAAALALSLGVEEKVVAPVLDRLVRARLLRVLERVADGTVAYELAHEYLIGEIHQSGEAEARKQTEELVSQEVENWQQLGTLISAEKLALVGRLRGQLRLSGEAHELLLRSALQTDVDIENWLTQVDDESQRVSILGDAASGENASVRQRAVYWLGRQGTPESIKLLARSAVHDPDDTVRDTARDGLSQAAEVPAYSIDFLKHAARGINQHTRQAALQTLARIPSAKLSPGVRWRARYASARISLGWGLVAVVVGIIVGTIILGLLIQFIHSFFGAFLNLGFELWWEDIADLVSTLLAVAILGGITGTVQHTVLLAGTGLRGRRVVHNKVLQEALLLGTGLEHQDLVNLRWKNLIRRDDRTVLEVAGKGQNARVIPISEQLRKLLDEWREFLKPRPNERVMPALNGGCVLRARSTLWIASTAASGTIGWLLGSFLTSPVLVALSGSSSDTIARPIAGVLFGTFLALAIASSQWWWFRQESWARQWIWLTTIGVVGIALFGMSDVFRCIIGIPIAVVLFSAFWRLNRFAASERETIAVTISLLVGCLVWGATIYSAVGGLQREEPIETRWLPLPIEYVRQPVGSAVSTSGHDYVDIDISGPSSLVAELATNDFAAVVDLSQVPFGETTRVDIQIRGRGSRLSEITISAQPEQVDVLLEQISTRHIPVELDVRGYVADGHVRGDPLIQPESITVSGQASRVEIIDHAQVTILLDNARETWSELAEPIFYDQQHKPVSVTGLTLSAEQVEVITPVNEK